MKQIHVSPTNVLKRNWMVIYTRPRWEKKVDHLLQTQDINSYCPITKVQREWSDRQKMVEVPLFNSYLFVKINAYEQTLVRQTLGVVNFVYFQGKPAIVNDKVIEDIQHLTTLCHDMEMVNIKELSIGDRIKIKNGALGNQVGNVTEIQGKHVLMTLDNLGCLLIAKVPANNIIIA